LEPANTRHPADCQPLGIDSDLPQSVAIHLSRSPPIV
jgi:hypothetical protein